MEGTRAPLGEGVVSMLHLCYTPLLVALGCLGNALTVLVLAVSKLRAQSTGVYLRALAASDSAFLLLQVPPWLDNIGATDVFVRRGYCQLFVYASYVSCCLSAWLVAAFTVERFVAVHLPLQRAALCTAQRATYIVLTLTAAALIANAPVLRFASAFDDHCQIDRRYMADAAAFNMCDTVMSFTLPLLVIVVLNTRIAITVVEVSRQQRALLRSPGADDHIARASPAVLSQHKITRMLLFVSTVFVLFNLPAYVIRLLAYAYDMSAADQSGFWSSAQQVAILVFNTNFGINFILYCLSGQNFRRALVNRLPRCLRRARPVEPGQAIAGRIRASSISTSIISQLAELQTRPPETASAVIPPPSSPSRLQRMLHRVRTRGARAPRPEIRASIISQVAELQTRPPETAPAVIPPPSSPSRLQLALRRVRTRWARTPQPVIRRWKFDNSRQVAAKRAAQLDAERARESEVVVLRDLNPNQRI